MNFERTFQCTLMFSTEMDLVAEWTYPKSQETDKNKKTDYRCSHPVGGQRGVFPVSYEGLCSNKSYIVWMQLKLEERDILLGLPESSYSRLSLITGNAAVRLGAQWDHFLLPCIVIHGLCCLLRLHSQCCAIQDCSWRGKFLCAYKHVFLWL